jgi:DNA-binding transcriptional regulator YdaS (Cro superfamily)
MPRNSRSNPSRRKFEETAAELIATCGKSQKELANLLGYHNANVITMFKQGSTRIPANKVVPLARAAGVLPGPLLRAWFRAYMPAVLPDIDAHMHPR